MTKKQRSHQLRLAAIAVIFAALAILFMPYTRLGPNMGVVSGVQTGR